MTKRSRGARTREEYVRRRALAEKLRRRGLASVVYEAGEFRMDKADAGRVLEIMDAGKALAEELLSDAAAERKARGL